MPNVSAHCIINPYPAISMLWWTTPVLWGFSFRWYK